MCILQGRWFLSPGSFQCPHCEKRYKAKQNLEAHLRTKHRTGEVLQCTCGKRFNWPSMLSKHRTKCPKAILDGLDEITTLPGTPNFSNRPIDIAGSIHHLRELAENIHNPLNLIEHISRPLAEHLNKPLDLANNLNKPSVFSEHSNKPLDLSDASADGNACIEDEEMSTEQEKHTSTSVLAPLMLSE